jgi:serine/threonine protein kinase
MVLEFAAGGSVHKILSSDHLKSRLTPNSRLYIVETLSAALEYLHSKKIFHRDIKPENICLWEGWETNPKMVLIDFGIASRVAANGASRTMTSNPGTTPYMADEYLHYPFKFTAKSEVFSVGVILVCLLTGDCSFSLFNHRICTLDVLMKHIDTSAGSWVSGCHQEVGTIALEALKAEESKRPTIVDMRKRVKYLRDSISSYDYVPAAAKTRTTSFTTTPRPSRLSAKVVVGGQQCIRCGLLREDGITCPKNHFTCSEGTCLEEMVREQLGSLKFRCCGNHCSKLFDVIDFYGKVSPLLYGELLMTMDRKTDQGKILADMQNCIAKQLQSHILPALVQSLSCGPALGNQASLDDIKSNIERLIKMASDNDLAFRSLEKQMNRLIVKQECGAAGISQQHKHLSKKIDALIGAHADGVAKLASGRLQCPRWFVFIPVRSRRGRWARGIGLATEYQLYFLCSHDHSPVKTSVLIKHPKMWIKKALPIVKLALLTIRFLVASYGVATPAITQLFPGVSESIIIEEMANFLDNDALAEVEQWVDEACQASSDSLSEYMEKRAREISEEAYASLAIEAYKPENRGWMEEMDIAQKGSVFAWVKKENAAFVSSSGGTSFEV